MTADYHDIGELIHRLRRDVNWKPAAAARHLLKRKLRGHLPPTATLTDYEAFIRQVLTRDDASVYTYNAVSETYLAVAALLDGRLWLVIASFEGIMETAFIVENPETYLEREAFHYLGTMSEVMQ